MVLQQQGHRLVSGNTIRRFLKEGRLADAFQAVGIATEQGFRVSAGIVFCLLQGCIDKKDLSIGKKLHGFLERNGFLLNSFIGCHLIRMFAACESLLDAHQVFCSLPEQDVFTWTAIISAHAQLGQGELAITLYHQMQQSNVEADEYLFVAVLRACASIAALPQGSILIDMYARCGRLADAQSVFEKLPKHDRVTWSAMIAGYAQHGRGEEALHLFEQMLQEGMQPNDAIFVSALKACVSTSADYRSNLIHGFVIESGYDSDACVSSMLIDMLAKLGSLEEARRVFDSLGQGVVSWTTMIAGYSQHGHGQVGLRLFEQMQQEAQMPNNVTLISALNACSSIAALSQGKLVHARLMASGFDLDAVVGIALINMYTKCGSLESAARVFENLACQSLEMWTAIIVACTEHGDYKLALHYFESMGQRGLKPDEITFICLLSACSHAGQVYEGCHLFRSMIEKHSITLRLDHYNSMVNLLGGAGCLTEAEDLLLTMPVLSNVVGWTALLTYCKTYNNVELGGRCFNEVVTMD